MIEVQKDLKKKTEIKSDEQIKSEGNEIKTKKSQFMMQQPMSTAIQEKIKATSQAMQN